MLSQHRSGGARRTARTITPMSDATPIDLTNSFFLGGTVDRSSGERTGDIVQIESQHLTTHGVIVGMTGSGKTGLGVDLLEEALLDGIPCLVLDPKGDMGNLMLNFPELRPSDFRPWIDEAEAVRNGENPDTVAADTADLWKSGLASWGIEPDRLRRLQDEAGMTIYTPGSRMGTPLDVIGSLDHPGIDFESNAEVLRDEIEGWVSSLLTLAGVDADPVSDPGHILLATIIEGAWSQGASLTIEDVLIRLLDPPMRKLGVFEVDTFFPRKDRMALATRLNGVVASPSFAAWSEGASVDIESMLWTDGKPQAAIIYLSHLSESERQFVVTLLLSKVVTWMRRQSGTSGLRALIYMDEVFGFAPPTAEPPSKKPILTILKQARAYGVGMVLSTQNPVDLDYKAMSNAGTWMVGRLQTERDKARILEGLASAAGTTDIALFDDMISGLGKRQFVLQSTHRSEPTLFGTRWAQSYLAGPLTREQVHSLTPAAVESTLEPGLATTTPETTPPDDDTLAVAPEVADGVDVSFVTPSAPWIGQVGGSPNGTVLRPVGVATVDLLYDDQYADVNHTEVFEAVIDPLDDVVTEKNLIAVDHDERDFTHTAPDGARYAIVDEPIGNTTWWRSLEASLADRLYRDRSVTVFKNPALKLYSRIGESREDFTERCAEAAEQAADSAVSGLRKKYETRIDRVQDQLRSAERRVSELEVDVSSRKQQEMVSGVGDLLGSFLGGRRGSTALKNAASRRSMTRRTEERLESARAKVSDELTELADLEDDLADDLAEIVDDWNAKATKVEQVDIPLEKSDISVRRLELAWIPTEP